MNDVRCAQLARALDEPLAGTALHAPRWLCLELPRPWAKDTAEDLKPAVGELAARCTATGWRLTFIRRPGRAARLDRHRVLLADTTLTGCRLHGFDVDDPAELLELDLAALATEPTPDRAGAALPGTPLDDPALLVCTHGRRDACCALAGRVLAAAVDAAEPGTWECSHLGGHRFAPTAVVLPTGYLYGRLDADHAAAARKAAGMGELELSRCRGRATWPAAGQVAELAVRARTGLRDATALTVEPAVVPAVVPTVEPAPVPAVEPTVEPSDLGADDDPVSPGEATTVTVRHRDGRVWQVRVRRAELRGSRPTSCGARPEPLRPLVAESIQEIDDHRPRKWSQPALPR